MAKQSASFHQQKKKKKQSIQETQVKTSGVRPERAGWDFSTNLPVKLCLYMLGESSNPLRATIEP